MCNICLVRPVRQTAIAQGKKQCNSCLTERESVAREPVKEPSQSTQAIIDTLKKQISELRLSNQHFEALIATLQKNQEDMAESYDDGLKEIESQYSAKVRGLESLIEKLNQDRSETVQKVIENQDALDKATKKLQKKLKKDAEIEERDKFQRLSAGQSSAVGEKKSLRVRLREAVLLMRTKRAERLAKRAMLGKNYLCSPKEIPTLCCLFCCGRCDCVFAPTVNLDNHLV